MSKTDFLIALVTFGLPSFLAVWALVSAMREHGEPPFLEALWRALGDYRG
ncbi:hypothetical protein [Mesorhizobium sp.]|nr:hypothetical protein [Mesorhizobium sp.]